MSNLLELNDVEARYGPVLALRGISLFVPEGAVVAVLGANGAGKTTTLRSVSGTVKRSGEILLDGKPLRCGPEASAKAGVAHVPEGRGTFTELSVTENLRLGAYTRRTRSLKADIDRMALPPCHLLFQFYVADGRLSCQLYQRSADIFLGVPFNIASYALLTHMVAQQTGLEVGDFVWTGGDCHLYSNHLEQVRTQLSREPMALPRLNILRKPDDIFGYRFEDFELVGYESHPAIKAPVAV